MLFTIFYFCFSTLFCAGAAVAHARSGMKSLLSSILLSSLFGWLLFPISPGVLTYNLLDYLENH